MNESNIFIWIASFAVLSTIVNGFGILAIYRYKEWAEKAKIYFMCFAAGLLSSVPLMVTLPKAIESNFYAGLSALLGFLFMFFSNKLIKYRTKKKELAFGITAAEGIGIHSLIDGVIYTITFKVSILVGVLSALGLVIHEFAEGVITYVFWMSGGAKKKTAAFYAFLVAGLTTPLGALNSNAKLNI
ncbi:MAG: zinc/iron permease [Acidobacteriota bacterium]|nr:zinc/iron permease [Acidobacteriota bacterium]